jgi:hypothetical protein
MGFILRFLLRRQKTLSTFKLNLMCQTSTGLVPSSSALIPMSICTLQCLFSHSFTTYEWLNRDCDVQIYIGITSRWTGYWCLAGCEERWGPGGWEVDGQRVIIIGPQMMVLIQTQQETCPDRKTDFYYIGTFKIKVDSTWSQGRTWLHIK